MQGATPINPQIAHMLETGGGGPSMDEQLNVACVQFAIAATTAGTPCRSAEDLVLTAVKIKKFIQTGGM